MSEEKVHEINPEAELKNSAAPNQFATSIGNLLTRSNPERAIGDAIDHLVDQRLHWENHELASSNDALYALLQHCYSLNNAMSGSDGTAKALRKGLANYIQDKKYQFKESSPLIAKIVKCVFGVDRRRVNAYSSALRVAMAEKIAVTVTVAPSDAKSITSFSLDGVAGTINSATKAISVVMPFGTSVTSLIETFTTTGSQVSVGGATQVSGLTSENYTSPVIYVVSAADASTSSYTVTVSIAPSSAKLLAAYSLSGVTGIINNANKTISVYLPYGSSVIDLIATFTTTGATINVGGTPQVSSTTSNNFTLPVVYTVTASDASTASYTVTVTLAPSNEKLLTAFSISGIAGTINQATKEINVVMPRGTSVTALIDTFSTTGASIAVGTTNQISGTTINNFTSPVSFLVTAVDGSTSSYTVNVTVTVAGPPTVALGNAGNFVLFANTGMSSAVNSTITGNVGVGPAVTSTAITTGFTLTPVGAYATAPQVTGKVYAYDYAAPTPSFIVSSSNDMLTAYNDARGRLNPDFTNVAGGNLSGISLEPGLYKWTTSVNLTAGSSVTLNGGPNDVWILQIAGTVTTGAGSRIVLTGGALPKNIFWQLDTALTMGASSIFNGIVLTGTAVTVGANSTVNGRFLAQTAITMDSDTITEP